MGKGVLMHNAQQSVLNPKKQYDKLQCSVIIVMFTDVYYIKKPFHHAVVS